MYPFLSGRAATVTLAATMNHRDVADAVVRAAADQAHHNERSKARRGARRAPSPLATERHGWSLAKLVHLHHLHGRGPERA